VSAVAAAEGVAGLARCAVGFLQRELMLPGWSPNLYW
jgi:hypothetical protein